MAKRINGEKLERRKEDGVLSLTRIGEELGGVSPQTISATVNRAIGKIANRLRLTRDEVKSALALLAELDGSQQSRDEFVTRNMSVDWDDEYEV